MRGESEERDLSRREEVVDRQKLGARLRETRAYLGLSQDEVARYLGIPRTALSQIERGHRRVDVLELKKVAQLYKRPLAHFMGEPHDHEIWSESEEVKYLARATAKLSESDRKELNRFADYLQARAQSEGSADG